MSDSALVLGPVVLDDFEIASGVTFGGGQRMVVHDLPGGRRLIDVLGRQDATIRFQGFLSGSDASGRARVLDELRAAGAVLPLTWDAFIYAVVIRSFIADYQCGWWIPYRIECTVLRDEAAALVDAAVDLGTDVLGDLGAAAGFGVPPSLGIGAAQAAAGVAGAAVAGTAAYVAAKAATSGACLAISGAMTVAAAAVDPNTLFGAATAAAGIASLNAMVATTGTLSSLAAAAGYAGRAQRNLADAST